MIGISLAVTGIIFFVLLLILIILGVPVTFSIGLSSIITMLLTGIDLTTAAKAMVLPVRSFPLLGVFLFTFMGVVFEKTGLTSLIVDALQPIFGRVKGGLAVVTVVGCAFFGLLTGAVAATAAAFSRIMGPEMEHRGYPREFAAATITASSPLGAFIPPSIPAIIIAVATNTSVISMFFVAAALGVLVMLALIIAILVVSFRKGYGGLERRYTLREIIINILKAAPLVAVPLSVLGGIYLGIFSVTEAGALGAIAALLVAAAYRTLTPKKIAQIFIEACKTTAVVLLMIGASYILNYTWSLSGLNEALIGFFRSISAGVSPFIALLILAGILAVLGMFFDVIVLAIAWGATIISALAPYGINPYHINALFLYGVLLGTSTPPVGAGVFVVAQSLNIEIEKVLKAILPFLLVYLILYIFIVLVPEAVLWLPRVLGLPV